MKIGLLDLDNYTNKKFKFPNIPLMKLSAWHKKNGDEVVWYEPLLSGYCDKVYISKVFSFTPDFPYNIDAKEVIKGGSGYCISTINGVEVYDKTKDKKLPDEIEHIYPDYSIYNIKNTAYGFLSRGCPRGCSFCHVATKEGKCAYKVADLREFWDGQKNIEICDPNILACKDWRDLLLQLKDSNSNINFNQGLDIRLMTEEKAVLLKELKIKHIHFAWDRYQDKELITKKLKMFKELTGFGRQQVSCYVLTNYDTTMAQNLERVEFLRSLDFNPYITIYNITSLPRGNELRKLQRYVNCKWVFWSCPSFEEYQKK